MLNISASDKNRPCSHPLLTHMDVSLFALFAHFNFAHFNCTLIVLMEDNPSETVKMGP